MNERDPIHENELFRFYTCGLSIFETSQLCCVSTSVVESWDAGKRIPLPLRRLMTLHASRDLSLPGWEGWSIHPGKIITASGYKLTPQLIESWCVLYAPATTVRSDRMSSVRARLIRQRFNRS